MSPRGASTTHGQLDGRGAFVADESVDELAKDLAAFESRVLLPAAETAIWAPDKGRCCSSMAVGCGALAAGDLRAVD